MKKLSARQMEILDFIKKEVKEKGYPPSVREIAEAVGLASSSTVHGHLDRLEKKGLIRRDPSKPRAIEILDGNRAGNTNVMETVKTVTVPVIGKVTAGMPITAVENVEEYFVLPENIVGSDLIYMLRIQGESMIEAGIWDDDYVIVRQQNTANNGDIVVAMTAEDEATVKRIFKEKDHIRLQPENSNMAPIILSNVVVLGKVIGLYRNIH
ncbi:XRE family transcriptional regulator [Aneurinibacillus migulanus]|uniref:transcriptional repressor LexA n=1 Tax=Aneurinibacillus migulanus TaxID=47500 RepID=UPI0005BCD2AA|nr:transcriptional repressor LexA [Aneurinibacillus migulanus]KIV58119.1 XRE family transcriptional regulator [Aneurinibacillus migulanus]KPD05465.1 XRE family transcriptional regulator [Aneurinibacillus migulanus]